DKLGRTPLKKKRDKIYKACGYIIFGTMLLLLVYVVINHIDEDGVGRSIGLVKPVFIGEFIMLWAFGFSWLVKGEIIWKE
ncbi:MAG: hypothetical protein AAFW89_15045, partial [Bacteroidota bacterium]